MNSVFSQIYKFTEKVYTTKEIFMNNISEDITNYLSINNSLEIKKSKCISTCINYVNIYFIKILEVEDKNIEDVVINYYDTILLDDKLTLLIVKDCNYIYRLHGFNDLMMETIKMLDFMINNIKCKIFNNDSNNNTNYTFKIAKYIISLKIASDIFGYYLKEEIKNDELNKIINKLDFNIYNLLDNLLISAFDDTEFYSLLIKEFDTGNKNLNE